MTRAKWLRRPTDLSGEALKYWRLHAPALYQSELLTPENAETLKLLCRLLAAARIAADEIEQFGVTIETSSGIRRGNPAVGALISAQRAARPLLLQFGLAEG